MTKGLLNSTRKEHEFAKKVKKHPINTKLKSYYRMYRNKLICLIRAIGNPKLTWNSINDMTGSKKVNNNNGNIHFINNNGQCINVVKVPVAAANILNNFFINIGKEYSEKFKNNLLGGCNITCKFLFNELFLVPIEKNEVTNIIKNLKDEQHLVSTE